MIASTSPESGRVVHDDDEKLAPMARSTTPDEMSDETVPGKVPFKEQVIGYAQVRADLVRNN
jgi:hypothetical protein